MRDPIVLDDSRIQELLLAALVVEWHDLRFAAAWFFVSAHVGVSTIVRQRRRRVELLLPHQDIL